MRIIQFHSGTAVGDAITNQMLMIDQFFKTEGFHSAIYAEHIPGELKGKIKNISFYNSEADDVMIIHHSMGFDGFERIASIKAKKILIYHNITPERFFTNQSIINYIRIGLEQAQKYEAVVDRVIADSNYNRKELLKLGYTCDVDVMPITISLDRFSTIEDNTQLSNELKGTHNILFVGRVVKNKQQIDIVRCFAVYNRYYDNSSQLFLVGDNSDVAYVDEIKTASMLLGVNNNVHITGKVNEQSLKSYYKNADLFLCMSEHEGFGVPLLEAMTMGVPVLAYDSSAISEVMDGAGIITDDKNYAYIGAMINEVISDASLRERIIERQNRRIKKAQDANPNQLLLKIVKELVSGKKRNTSIQLQGPFETSYSLAKVNRDLIEAIDDKQIADISIHCTEGPGDYVPNKKDVNLHPHAKELWEKDSLFPYPDITIRNMYPPRVRDVNGAINLQSFGWEESLIPKKYVNDFNKYSDGIGTMSDYVTQVLINNGITIPVKTMGIGVSLPRNYVDLPPYKLATGKKFRFLHISSAFPRKGVDVLIKGFYKAFTCKDDVCLVLKTFPNIHNNVKDIISRLNSEFPSHPEIEWYDEDLSDNKLYGLYKSCNCYVQVSRGEGFGLPVAEAMLAKIPVIVSPNSGMADFCNEETSWIVGFDMAEAGSHLQVDGSKTPSFWFEPRIDDLVNQFRFVYQYYEDDIVLQKVQKAFNLISEKFTWSAVADRWLDFIDEIRKQRFKPSVDMVTTWNSKCGIAEYTKLQVNNSCNYVDYNIYPNMEVPLIENDTEIVKGRYWKADINTKLDELIAMLKKSNSTVVHIQFNFGFFNLAELSKMITELCEKKEIVITFHKTSDATIGNRIVSLRQIVGYLNKCAALIVHGQDDIQRLESFGVSASLIKLIPHGQIVYPQVTSDYAKSEKAISNSLVIGSYGFLLPHKGIHEMIKAMDLIRKQIPDALYMPVCSIYDCSESKDYYKQCCELISELGLEKNVKMITSYLSNDESMKYLQACDLLVMPYGYSKESASGAVRFCLAADRPVIASASPIFDEVRNYVYTVEKISPERLAEVVANISEDIILQNSLVNKQREYVKKNSWYNVCRAYYHVYTDCIKNRERG